MIEHSLLRAGGAKGDSYPYLSQQPRHGTRIEVVRTMRTIPITKEALLQLGLVTFLPLLPLLLTAMPLEDLLKKLLGLLF